MQVTPRRLARSIPKSPRFEAVAHQAQFRDLIAVRVRATPEAIFDAAQRITLGDMQIARVLGQLRYLPGRLAGRPPVDDPNVPFLTLLREGGTLVLDDAAPAEIVLGSAGRLHQLIDQTPVRFENVADFHAFDAPGFEKLFMSLRVVSSMRPGEQLLVLEHATQALSPDAEQRFRRYWRAVKPTGAFVSARLLNAIRARAESGDPRSRQENAARAMARWAAVAAGTAAGVYAVSVALTWWQYGRPSAASPDERDALLDRFVSSPDIVERHHVRVDAPAETTLEAAKSMKLSSMPLVRAIFRGRELILRSAPADRPPSRDIVTEMLSLGWGVLAEVPGREIAMGAVTRPWESNVTFRAVPPEAFAAFDEPEYVKIAWTLRADPLSATTSMFRTETRAVATDAAARRRFRRYWALLSPGIRAIRWLTLIPVKREAERRAARADEPVNESREPREP